MSGRSIPILCVAFNFHPNEKLVTNTNPFAGRTSGKPCDDTRLVTRIVHAYQSSAKNHLGDSVWQIFYDHKVQEINEIFQSGDLTRATQILRNPGKNDLFYGIDSLCVSLLSSQLTYDGLVNMAGVVLDHFLRCGEAIGAFRLFNPEYDNDPTKQWTANEILKRIENSLKISIPFPNPYPDEVGLCTYNGVASYRAIQAIYQAYRIKELVKHIPSPRILEIGAGLGRTAFYCRLMGITDYTIIDIPMTSLASSYFLGRVVGEGLVA